MGNNHPKGQIGREVQETDVLFNLDDVKDETILKLSRVVDRQDILVNSSVISRSL